MYDHLPKATLIVNIQNTKRFSVKALQLESHLNDHYYL